MARNVLYLVLDCLRTDAITPETAPNLSRLAAQNCSFESCVAPANWSLPSHASIFTGEWAHEHHCFRRDQQMERLPLVEAFGDRGYTTVGLTSNIYFSQGQGFGTGFDEFYETRRPLNPHGLNPFSAVRHRQPPEGPELRTYLQVLGDAVRHERPVASLANYLRAVWIELDSSYRLRERLPGLDSDDYGSLTRATERTERLLNDVFDRHADGAVPFFAFANLMDTHFPYEPPARHLAAETDGEYDRADLDALDPDLSNSWVFLDRYFADDVDEDALELVRAAYRAEVRSVDERVGQLLDALEARDLREETLVVVTSDHGEVLGETDLRGERSMGHLDSVSEHLRTVPLILANPAIDAETVERRVPLTALSDQLSTDPDAVLDTDDPVGDLLAPESPVLFELPANPFHESSYERYDHIPDWYVTREALTHTVVGFDEEWTVIADSTGELDAWEGTASRNTDDAPEHLVDACESAVRSFPADGTESAGHDDLSASRQQQLEDLGYM
ncbi:sulfatase-like hydrolase/transferase [Haloarchaeobius baliensis]|uniref:sulfatase-like hydrolase/transferase n=1 Tax=Haloarchaeobius baliensis TaxID=1670458 RepID=UPI003F882BA1